MLFCLAVSGLTEKLWDEYEAFAMRDLAAHCMIYRFVNGIAERHQWAATRSGAGGLGVDEKGLWASFPRE